MRKPRARTTGARERAEVVVVVVVAEPDGKLAKRAEGAGTKAEIVGAKASTSKDAAFMFEGVARQ